MLASTPASILNHKTHKNGIPSDSTKSGYALVGKFKEAGLDFIDVSLGFSTPAANIPWGPGFIAPYADQVRKATGLPGAASWNITQPEQADELIRSGQLDLVMIGKAMLANPHWPYEAARKLGVERPSWTLPAPYAHWLASYRTA